MIKFYYHPSPNPAKVAASIAFRNTPWSAAGSSTRQLLTPNAAATLA
jgi:hypothetical protein